MINIVKGSNQRSRKFCLVSYLNLEQIKVVLAEHSHQIQNYAYILHDKDKYKTDGGEVEFKEPHYHILIITFNATTLSAVRRWFFGFVDSELKDINTLGQYMTDAFAMYDYIQHSENSDDELIYHYDSADICCIDKTYFLGSATSGDDNAYLMFLDMVNGVSFKTMARKYGRDFIFHYSALRTLVFDYLREREAFGDSDDINRRCPLDWN